MSIGWIASKVEGGGGGGGPIDLLKRSYNYFFFEAPRVKNTLSQLVKVLS